MTGGTLIVLTLTCGVALSFLLLTLVEKCREPRLLMLRRITAHRGLESILVREDELFDEYGLGTPLYFKLLKQGWTFVENARA